MSKKWKRLVETLVWNCVFFQNGTLCLFENRFEKKRVFSLTDFIHDKKFHKYYIKLEYVWLIQIFYSNWSFFSLKIFLVATSFWLFPPVSLIWVLLSVTLSCVITRIFQNNSICQFNKYTSNIITLRVWFYLKKSDWSSL